ncbi:MAG TPA: flagellar hook-basal body complex protein, partial [Candidatus Cloacimonadota bacterium]|nr:flagellar hook-basal body complex protein [Candidatus Cloacimonadota bacterium]
MLRSLYSGITGVKNQQAQMDVISNNIANVNTTGFKSNRITFADALSETISGARGTAGNFGGANPVQIGRGSVISSVDTNYKQGSLDSTGQVTDLAINGKGFFVVTDGTRRFFSRAGALQVQDDGSLMSQGGNYYMMGRAADTDGNLPSTTAIQKIVLPFGRKEPAKATSNIDLYCNLDKNGSKIEEWVGGAAFKTSNGKAANGATDLAEIDGLKMHLGDQIEITGTLKDGTKILSSDNQNWTFTYGKDGTTIDDLMNKINQAYNSTSIDGSTCSIDQNGKFRLIANSGGENNTTIFLTATTKHTATTESHESEDKLESINYPMSVLESDDSNNYPLTINITGYENNETPPTDAYVIANKNVTVNSILNDLNSQSGTARFYAELDGNNIVIKNKSDNSIAYQFTNTLSTIQNASITSDLLDISGAYMEIGGQLKIEGTNPDGTYKSSIFTYGAKEDGYDGKSMKDLLSKINSTFYGVTATFDNTTGKIKLTDNSSGESHTSIWMSNMGSTKGFDIEFTKEKFEMKTAFTYTNTANTPPTLDNADSTTLINELNQISSAYQDNDQIKVLATLMDGTTKSYTYSYTTGDTLNDLVSQINNSNEFPGMNAELINGKIVFSDSDLSDDYNYTSFQIVEGSRPDGTLNKGAGLASFFENSAGSSAGSNNSVIQLPSFAVQVEGETGKHSTTIDVYDNIGQKHTVEINYTQDTQPGTNKWFWNIVIDDGKIAPHSGNSGTASFNEDGSLKAFLYDNGDALKFNAPGGGEVSISLNAGNAGSFTGMTQLASASTNVAIQQDGYALGVLNNINVDDQGIISGIYSNGVTKT